MSQLANRPTPLANQRLLVVGGSTGIGRSVALVARSEGARVAVAARDGEALQRLADAEGHNLGAPLVPVPGDVRQPETAAALVERAESELGGIDVVVFAAGVNIKKRAIGDLEISGWRDVLGTNLDGAFYVTRAALPALRRQGGGLIIYISSGAAKKADLSGAAYQASKAGLAAFSAAVMEECRPEGIRTTVIFPGIADTPFIKHRPVPPTPEALQKALQPSDVAAACCLVMALPARAHVPELLIYPTLS